MKKFVVFSVLLLCLVFVMFSNDMISKADELFGKRSDISKLRQSIKLLEGYLDDNPASYDALWRLGEYYYHLGLRVNDNKEKKDIFDKSQNYCRRATLVNDDKVEGHYWLGVAYGKYGESKGVMKSSFLVKPIKKEMEKVIEKDESYECWGVYRVLGRLYFKLPGLFGGSIEKSLEYLQKEKKMCPSNLLGRYYLADTLRKADKEDEAIKELNFILNIEKKDVDPRWRPEYNIVKEKAMNLLKEIKE